MIEHHKEGADSSPVRQSFAEPGLDRKRPRTAWVDNAKGMAIMMVVVCHTINGLILAGILHRPVPVWAFLNDFFYTFQVPVFFLVSGLFAQRSLAKYGSRDFLKRKVGTLLYPYVVWQSIQIVLMIIAEGWANHLTDFRQLLLTPVLPYMQYWFLYVLFLVGAVYVALEKAGFSTRWMLVISLLMYAVSWIPVHIPWPPLVFTLRHFFYFSLGLSLSRVLLTNSISDQIPTASGILFGVILLGITACLVHFGWGYTSPLRILGATTGMAGVVFLSFALPRIPGAGIISRVGVRSLEIYVVHVICIAGVRGALISVFHVDQPLIHILAGITGGIVSGILSYQLFTAIGIDLFRAPFFSGANGRGKNGWRIRILSRG